MAHNDTTGRRKPTKTKKQARSQTRSKDGVDIEKLIKAVDALDVTETTHKTFEELPLSDFTKAGLKACHYITLTDIQAKAVPLALKGKDILGAAKTGSGKTLAFVVPVLENLYRSQCIGPEAGLGAMIISPTRELAIQIFDVLYRIGKHGHLFAAGLVIGGKSLEEEQRALVRMNLVVCTPGRILQHLSSTPEFGLDQLQMLVLDEADRCLDMGFERDVDAIIEYLPSERQNLCFSATQTRKVSDLARLSLRDPEYISIHEASISATPSTLQQSYVVTPLPDKLDTLWSFIQSSKKSKLLIFLSSGKQVRFVYETFRKMQPGIPLLHLHGRQKQTARLDITTRFSAARHACLFATDVAARGLDYPAIDWVVQLDCPEDVDTYIHRVGRTARYERDGKAVLFLDPSEEEAMLTRLLRKKVPIERINVRQKKQQSIKPQLQGMCFKDPELKYLGIKAFASYARSIHLQKDKEIFHLGKYALEDFAASLGLPGAPRIKFMKGDAEAVKRAKNAPRMRAISPSSEDESDRDVTEGREARTKLKEKNPVRTKYDRMFERTNHDVLADHYTRLIDYEEQTPADMDDGTASTYQPNPAALPQQEENDDLFTVKRRIPAIGPSAPHPNDDDLHEGRPLIDSNRRLRALRSKKKTAKLLGGTPTHLVFDDETGEARPPQVFDDEKDLWRGETGEKEAARRRFVEVEGGRLKEVDAGDREVAMEKRREKRDKRKRREKGGDEKGVERDDGDEDEGENGQGREVVERPFEELAGLYSDVEDDADVQVNKKETSKRKKKWFEDSDSDDDGVGGEQPGRKRKRRLKKEDPVPQTVEDLERLAGAVLG